MDAEITPEPTDEEREALLAALQEAGDGPGGLRAYSSPWRLAGLPGDPDEDGL